MLNKIFKRDIQDYKAKDLMTKNVITLQSQDNLLRAQRMMSRFRIKKIVVVDEDKNKKYLVGILTIKDIIKFLISDKTDRDLDEIAIFEAMTKNVITTIKNKNVVDCAKILDKNNISSLIVIEEEEENSEQQEQQRESSANKKISLSGIITSTDFTRFFSENCIGLASVKDYMSQPIFTISIDEKVSRAIQLMLEKNVSRLVVTAIGSSHSISILGILSETDISRITPALKSRKLRSVYENMELLFGSSKRNLDFIEPALVRIEDIFTPNPITIEKDADLAEAAKLMVKQGISGIPVIESSLVEEGGGKEKIDSQPIGMISKTNIVRALTDIK
jgi:CBS domain-containing protein